MRTILTALVFSTAVTAAPEFSIGEVVQFIDGQVDSQNADVEWSYDKSGDFYKVNRSRGLLAEAGFKKGDRIIKINGKAIAGWRVYARLKKRSALYKVTVEREGKAIQLEIVLFDKKKVISLADDFFKKRQWQKAEQLYQKALVRGQGKYTYIDESKDGALVYRFGGSLYATKKYEMARKAYQKAIELKYKRSDLAFYNIACSYSLQNNASAAKSYLLKARLAGYKAMRHMGQDSDLAAVRATPGWPQVYAALKKKDPVGLYKSGYLVLHNMLAQTNYIVLCSNGSYYDILGVAKNSNEDCNLAFSRGKWSAAAKGIKLRQSHRCGTRRGHWDVNTGCSTKPSGYPFSGCSVKKAGEILDYTYLRRQLIGDYSQDDDSAVVSSFVYFEGGEPPQCESSKLPESSEDLFRIFKETESN